MSGDHLVIIANWWRIAFISPFATIFSTVWEQHYKRIRMLANFLPTLWLLNNQFAEFPANPLRMLRMLTNALANACEPFTNETATQRKGGELHIPLPMFHFITYSQAKAESTSVKVQTNASKCLTITTNALPSIRMAYENVAKTMRIYFPCEF